MNFLFHCWEYPPHAGGVGRYIRNMSEALVRSGHFVVVAVGKAQGMPDSEEQNGVLVRRCFSRNDIYSNLTAEKVLKLCTEYSIDLIEGADHLGCSSKVLAATKRPPVVVKCHSCSILHAAHEQSHVFYWWQKWVIRLARLRGWQQARHEKRSIELADVLIAPSKIILDEMTLQGLQLPSRQLVIPNPIESISLFDSSEAVRPTLLFVGRLDIGKGIQYLPEILRLVSQLYPDVCLEIVGADSFARGLGSLQGWLEKCFAKNRNRVTWLGYLDEKEVQEAMNRAWVLIVPSRWDTFPTVLLEAMAHGKAVVVSDSGGIPEMVDNTDIPVCTLDEAVFAKEITNLLENSGKRLLVGKSGRDKVLNCYSPQAVAAEYIKMAEGVLG